VEGVRAFVVEAKAVDGVDTEELDFAGVNEIGEGGDHSLPFQLPFVTCAGGKTDDGRTPMAINDDTHFYAKSVRVPAMVVALHESGLPNANSFAELESGDEKRGSGSMPAEERKGN
jgi:hypothetical protein